MGIPVLVMGESGSGKTYSIKNFDVDEVGIFSVEKNRMPFRKQFKIAKGATYATFDAAFQNPTMKKYVIDDSQYLLVNEMFDRAQETGYQKYTDMALKFRNLIHSINKDLPDDVIVYFLHHTQVAKDSGKIKAKTIGQMLDQYLTVEGLFDIVLLAESSSNDYHFLTQSDGYTTAKSPEDMFELQIPNDLKLVDQKIREYYGLEG